jgi:hypothetical protein
MRRPACARLLVGPGGVPFITVRETFEIVMSVATEGTGALAVTTAVIAAIVTNRVKTAGIVVMTAVTSAMKVNGKIVSVSSARIAAINVSSTAVVIAIKIVLLASAVVVAKPAVPIANPKTMGPIADTRLATAPRTQAKRAAIVVNVESGAATAAMTAIAATDGAESSGVIER